MQRMFGYVLTLYLFYGCKEQQAVSVATPANSNVNNLNRSFNHKLGNKLVSIRQEIYGNKPDVVMISLHDDEITSVNAAKKVLKKTGGVLRISNDGERLITFTQNKRAFTFDPNRMFTKPGIKATLIKHNIINEDAAMKTIENFARFCLEKIPSSHTLIALHNNEERGLSILSYMKGGGLEQEAAAVHRNETHDVDNFYLTTDQQLFELLKNSGFNVVLQDNEMAADDGSLSVYYGRRKKRYINIEARTGMLEEQTRMIETAVDLIRASNRLQYLNR